MQKKKPAPKLLGAWYDWNTTTEMNSIALGIAATVLAVYLKKTAFEVLAGYRGTLRRFLGSPQTIFQLRVVFEVDAVPYTITLRLDKLYKVPSVTWKLYEGSLHKGIGDMDQAEYIASISNTADNWSITVPTTELCVFGLPPFAAVVTNFVVLLH